MMGAAAINESDVEDELDEWRDELDEWREESEEGEDSQNHESSSNSSFLLELNLLFVFLSLISPNSNENSNGEDDDELMKAKEVEATTYKIARSSVKKKDVIEAKPEGRRAHQRFHTTIKDHRHGRKM